jgi:Zn-dependent M28 family amino/carboxypeptidase
MTLADWRITVLAHHFRMAIVLGLLLTCILPVTSQRSVDTEAVLTTLNPALSSVRSDEILQNIKILASNKFEGRNVVGTGETLTVNYLADQFKRAGLKPGNPDGTYFQKVPLTGFRTDPKIELTVNGKKLPFQFPDDFVHEFPRLKPNVTVMNAGIVFAGFGIVAPEFHWDDYKDVDVRNELVILMSGEPSVPDKGDPSKQDSAFFKGDLRTFYSTMEFKKELALKKGAAAVLFITDPEKSPNYLLFKTFALLEGFALRPQGSANDALAITGLVTANAAQRLFTAAGQNLESLQRSAERKDFKPVLINAKASISATNRLRNVESRNVVGQIEGSDPRLKREYVIYTAHWDHLGRDSRLKGDQIYNGAIDNAIGVAQLLAIARGLAKLPRTPKRSILFIATAGEEKGWLGARYYVRNPLFPLSTTLADINLDGGNVWGRTKDVNSSGYGYSTLDEHFQAAAELQGRKFSTESMDNNGLYFGSDNIEFARAGIPAFFAFGGFEYVGRPADFGGNHWGDYADKDYHKVSDEVGPDWDLSGAEEDARWLMIAGYMIAQADRRPQWKPGSEFQPK